MFKRVKNFKAKVRDWVIARAHSKHADWVLALISFTESAFLPFPPDILVIPLAAIRPKRWLRYVIITAGFSVLGGIAGYLIGMALLDTVGMRIIELYGLQDNMDKVSTLFQDNAFWAIFISAFTIIPYKVFTISAGIFGINFPIFVVASVLGRGLRFLIEAYVMKRYGLKIGQTLFKYFNIVTIVLALIGVALFFILRT